MPSRVVHSPACDSLSVNCDLLLFSPFQVKVTLGHFPALSELLQPTINQVATIEDFLDQISRNVVVVIGGFEANP